MQNQVFKNLRKIARIGLNIVCGVISIMFVIAFIATMKWNFLILAGSMAILYALVYLLSVSSEAIKKEYITAQMQIRTDEPIVFDKKKVLRLSYDPLIRLDNAVSARYRTRHTEIRLHNIYADDGAFLRGVKHAREISRCLSFQKAYIPPYKLYCPCRSHRSIACILLF